MKASNYLPTCSGLAGTLRWLALLLWAAAPAGAAITQSISYQGFLLSKVTNLPVETPQDIQFYIYDSASGGSSYFFEERCNVPVNKGRYDVEIGSASGGIPGAVFTAHQNLWLEIRVDPDGDCSGTYEAMTPRVRLQASPFAFNSIYASTASAATAFFQADTIGALPVTSNGAITISTNLFVQGGISVGSISPGQKLAVAGIVESSFGGFKFPDGSIQTEAAANTQWDVSGPHVYSINPGNVGIGENLLNPLARLHVSTAAGDAGDILLLSTGTSAMFRVNGLGQVYGHHYYGDGSTMTGVVAEGGDTMTGQLTLAGSSLTVTSVDGITAAKLRILNTSLDISGDGNPAYGGVLISTHLRLNPGAVYYGDGSGLSNVVTLDHTKVSTSGATMTGPLTLGYNISAFAGSSLTVTGDSWLKGNIAMGNTPHLARLAVGGGIIATSSITAQNGLYTTSLNASLLSELASVRATTATFWGNAATGDPATSYTITSSSGIMVLNGKVVAPAFAGDGSQLTSVAGTDATKLLKAGDTMTGHLLVSPASMTVVAVSDTDPYAITVASALAVNKYGFSVSTMGNVSIQVSNPSSQLSVYKQILITNDNETVPVNLAIKSDAPGYIHWSDAFGNLGAMGYRQHVTTRDFVFRALGSDTESGTEVFRIRTDDGDNSGWSWKFGVGITPTEKFHVGANMLVSNGASPILAVSTTTEMVSVGAAAGEHKLHVAGGIMATSSITAQGGFYGDGSGISNISAAGLPHQIEVSSIAARSDSTYSAIVVTSDTFVMGKLAVGEVFPVVLSPTHLRGTVTIDQREADPGVTLNMFAHNGGPIGINWAEGAMSAKASLSSPANMRDLVLNVNTTNDEVFRIKGNSSGGGGAGWQFGIGTASPHRAFHVATDVLFSTTTPGVSPILMVSTANGYVGISTGVPQERFQAAGGLLVGGDRAGALLYVSTATGYTGVGTGNPRTMLEIGNGNILADGTYSGTPTAPPVTGAGSRLLWMPINASFRAGGVTGPDALDSQYAWDTIGQYSVAMGQDIRAYANWASALGGLSNWANGSFSVVGGGQGNITYGNYSVIGGGKDNIVYSSYSFAGGRNNWLDISAEGTFVWGYDTTGGQGRFNTDKITQNFAFLIDPVDDKHYKVGVRTGAPQTAMDVNGDAQFGSGVNKSTFTAEGFWQPRSLTTAELQGAAGQPTAVGQVVRNSSIFDLCVSTGTGIGEWALVGSKGAGDCF